MIDAYSPEIREICRCFRIFNDAIAKKGGFLFKLPVNDALMANLTAAFMGVDPDTLKKLQIKCIKDVRETNGEINFEDAKRK